jgi:hypothetical protein
LKDIAFNNIRQGDFKTMTVGAGGRAEQHNRSDVWWKALLMSSSIKLKLERLKDDLLEDGLNRERRYFSRPCPAKGSFADGFAATYVIAALCGIADQAADIAQQAVEWSALAIATNEEHGMDRNGYLSMVRHTLAFSTWLAQGHDDTALWLDAQAHDWMQWQQRQHRLPGGRYRHEWIDRQLALRLQAGLFQEGVDFYRAEFKGVAFKLAGPKSPRQIAYAHCLQRLENCFDPAALLAAGRRMLAPRLADPWFKHGQFVTAAQWLKIVHWSPGSPLTPAEVIAKAWDDTPAEPQD